MFKNRIINLHSLNTNFTIFIKSQYVIDEIHLISTLNLQNIKLYFILFYSCAVNLTF